MAFQFTAEQARKYYETRMGGEIRKQGTSFLGKCPFHEDKNPSCSFNFEKGVWHCHTERIGGGLIDFEMKLNGTSEIEAVAAINAIIGVSQISMYSGKPEATYEYRDEQGRLLYQVLRKTVEGRKRISNRRPVGNGWEYTLEGTRRVLYRLPELIRSSEVVIVEGEKCADAVRQAFNDMEGTSDGCEFKGFTATTSPHGAGKWREEFAPFVTGKKVVLIPDNDAPGREHMETVARSVSKHAVGVKWCELPWTVEKEDVADYLETHSFQELLSHMAVAPAWQRRTDLGLFMPARTFMRHAKGTVDWRVEGIIERGTSGFFIALPKSGKSFATVALAVALAAGKPWLGFQVDEPCRVALVSREDSPGLTARRLRRTMLGMNLQLDDPWWDTHLMVNTREQTKDLMLEDDKQLGDLITAMQEKKIDFCILDVLNVLHGADENDNTEMRRVLNRVSQIRSEVGCQICIVHHSQKDWDDTKTLSQLARGSSAISGFAEFIVGIRMIDEETQTRQMRFETKSAEPQQPVYWKIRDSPITGAVSLEQVEYEDTKRSSPRKRAATIVAG